jgi:hypothetical protein
VRVNVPVVVALPCACPVTVLGASVKEERTGGTTVSDVVVLRPRLPEAVMTTGVDVPTGRAVTVKLAVVFLAGTETDAGTVTTPGLLLESGTTRAPAAGPLRPRWPVVL